MSSFTSVFRMAEACAILIGESSEEKNCSPLNEKTNILPISILQCNYNTNFNKADTTGGLVTFKNSFVIPELADSEYGITSLSVNNNKMLAGSYAA